MGIAFVFDGQGAQYPGMGKALAEFSPAARQVFDLADTIRPGTSRQCFEGTREELADTANTQPSLYTVNLAAAAALSEAGIVPDCVAGFSLGELSALAYAGAMTVEDGLQLTMKRGRLMADAAAQTSGIMAAVIGLGAEQVEQLCLGQEGFSPANYNSPVQTVVSGPAQGLPAFKQAAAALGGRVLALNVSGAFHSPFMQAAAEGFLEVLASVQLHRPAISVFSNLRAEPYGEDMKETLAGQISGPVKWTQTIERMAQAGIETFVAMGAGNTLCALIQKTAPVLRCYAVHDAQSLQAAVEALKA